MPPCLSISSTRVVLPWSTWAMMAMFLKCVFCNFSTSYRLRFQCHSKFPTSYYILSRGKRQLFSFDCQKKSKTENVTYIKIEDIKVTLKENIGYNEKLRIDYKINPLDASNTKLVWSVSGLKNGISAEFETNTETTKEEGTIKINLKNSLDEEVTLKLIAKQDDKVVSETTLKVEAKNTTIERVTKEVKEAINKLDTNLTKKNYEENKELLNEINDALENNSEVEELLDKDLLAKYEDAKVAMDKYEQIQGKTFTIVISIVLVVIFIMGMYLVFKKDEK